MKIKLLDGLLLILALAGGVLAWTSGRQASRLSHEYGRLVRLAGDLPITDPMLVHVGAIDTGEPLHFAWRVYFPANYQMQVATHFGGGGSSGMTSGTSTAPQNYIARVRVRENEQGQLMIYERFGGGSSMSGIGDKSLADFLHGRWDKVRVEQLGAPRPITLGPKDSAVVLRLSLPEEMREEARKALTAYAFRQFFPNLFELRLGPEPRKP